MQRSDIADRFARILEERQQQSHAIAIGMAVVVSLVSLRVVWHATHQSALSFAASALITLVFYLIYSNVLHARNSAYLAFSMLSWLSAESADDIEAFAAAMHKRRAK